MNMYVFFKFVIIYCPKTFKTERGCPFLIKRKKRESTYNNKKKKRKKEKITCNNPEERKQEKEYQR
mgnify:CR=1 FL=1